MTLDGGYQDNADDWPLVAKAMIPLSGERLAMVMMNSRAAKAMIPWNLISRP